MSDETWAQVSLRIESPRLTVAEIERLLGTPSASKAADLWAAELTADSATGLDEQLRDVKTYLRDKAPVLAAMTGAKIGLSIGWTPRSPQDGIVLDDELIALLAATRCHVLLDTYLD